MTNIATIKPGDRIIITEHGAWSPGDIVKVHRVYAGGNMEAAGRSVEPSQCLRILAPGDVIPKGAVTRWVMNDGTLDEDAEWVSEYMVANGERPRALVSLPEPEPSLYQQMNDLSDRYSREMGDLIKRIKEAS